MLTQYIYSLFYYYNVINRVLQPSCFNIISFNMTTLPYKTLGGIHEREYTGVQNGIGGFEAL